MPTPNLFPCNRRPPGRTLLFFLAANLALAACQGATPPPPAEALDTPQQRPAEQRPVAREEDERADARQGRLERLIERSWWREAEPVNTLALTADQQRSLDQIFESSWRRQRELRDEAERLETGFAEALAAGDFEAARERAETLAESAAVLSRAESSLRLDGLEVLTAEQRGLLQVHYPHLLDRPWLRFRSPRGGR